MSTLLLGLGGHLEQCAHGVEIAMGKAGRSTAPGDRRLEPARPGGARPESPQHLLGRVTRARGRHAPRPAAWPAQPPSRSRGGHRRGSRTPRHREGRRAAGQVTWPGGGAPRRGQLLVAGSQRPGQRPYVGGVKPRQGRLEQAMRLLRIHIVCGLRIVVCRLSAARRASTSVRTAGSRTRGVSSLATSTGTSAPARARWSDGIEARPDLTSTAMSRQGTPSSRWARRSRSARCSASARSVSNVSTSTEPLAPSSGSCVRMEESLTSGRIDAPGEGKVGGDPLGGQEQPLAEPTRGREGEHRRSVPSALGELTWEVEQTGDVGSAERVDRLVGVADDREVASVARDRPEQGDLPRVGVLVFVDEDVVGTSSAARRGGSGPRSLLDGSGRRSQRRPGCRARRGIARGTARQRRTPGGRAPARAASARHHRSPSLAPATAPPGPRPRSLSCRPRRAAPTGQVTDSGALLRSSCRTTSCSGAESSRRGAS